MPNGPWIESRSLLRSGPGRSSVSPDGPDGPDGDAAEAENGRDQGNDQEDQGPPQHLCPPCTGWVRPGFGVSAEQGVCHQGNNGSCTILVWIRFEAVTPSRRTGRAAASVLRSRSRAQPAMAAESWTGRAKVRERV